MHPMRELPVVPICRTYQRLRRRANHNDALAHPASMKRDVSADRHDTWGGDAMDAAARETNVAKADGEVVWSWRPKAGAKLADAFASRRRRGQHSDGRLRAEPHAVCSAASVRWRSIRSR